MFNLLKYELKKRKNTLIVGAIALAAAEAFTLYQLKKENIPIVLFLMGVMVVGVLLLVFLDVAIQYYNDFKKSQGTLLFLTPNSGGKIIGSKMLFGAMELLSGLIISGLFIWLTNSIAVNMGYSGIGPIISSTVNDIGITVGESNIWWVATGFVFLVFLQYTASQSIAIMSVTLGRTVMSRNNYNWLWAVLFFIGVSFVVQTINGLILIPIGFGGDFMQDIMVMGDAAEASINVSRFLIVGAIEYACWIAASFLTSSRMLNKRIDL